MTVHRVVNVTDFKAKCTAWISEVESSKKSIAVTRRGKTVAILTPPTKQKYKSLGGTWSDRMREIGDIVNTGLADSFDVVNGRPWPK